MQHFLLANAVDSLEAIESAIFLQSFRMLAAVDFAILANDSLRVSLPKCLYDL